GQRAGIMELVENLPQNWNTILSKKFEGGTDLSGGQWQRVALARAMFALECGAGVLVLDEPTANLDVRAESALYERFLDLTAGLTTIVVSHRFSTVRRADRIVVLHGGKIVESGTHDQLMALAGRYARMFDLQARYYADDADVPEDGAFTEPPAPVAAKPVAPKPVTAKPVAPKPVTAKAVAAKPVTAKAVAAKPAAAKAVAAKPAAAKRVAAKPVAPAPVAAKPVDEYDEWADYQIEYPEYSDSGEVR
ncbi:MAG: ATP-binding cassette, subfamily bacterial, partial [Actinomycetota bacterium]|nr:ATP-binding cassette, subfamily bacterial [Actinomycetota bacterium]